MAVMPRTPRWSWWRCRPGQIADALGKVSGLQGKVAIDNTNAYAHRTPPLTAPR
jgi:hypothetical protein